MTLDVSLRLLTGSGRRQSDVAVLHLTVGKSQTMIETNFFFELLKSLCLILLLLLLKEVGSARLRESYIHPISPKTTAPQYQLIDRKKRKGKIVEDFSW